MPAFPYNVVSKKSGKTYYLHGKHRGTFTLYYFAGKVGENAIAILPDGYEVTENERTGLPMLRKIKA